MINIPLSFWAMWLIMLLGVLTHVLAKINKINHDSPDYIPFGQVVRKFFRKEWASYGMSLIITGIIAYSFHFMKQFETTTVKELSYWAKYIPLAILLLYLIGVLNQTFFYYILGRIQSKGGNVNIDLLKEKPQNQ